jgi:3-oxoacyl-[acyl-carrier-protein] synthase III
MKNWRISSASTVSSANFRKHLFVLGDGKSLELTKQIKSNKEVFDCLKKFGLSNNDIKKVKNQTNNNRHVLRAVTNKCLRKLADETVDADDIRQFFIDQLDEVLNELKQL